MSLASQLTRRLSSWPSLDKTIMRCEDDADSSHSKVLDPGNDHLDNCQYEQYENESHDQEQSPRQATECPWKTASFSFYGDTYTDASCTSAPGADALTQMSPALLAERQESPELVVPQSPPLLPCVTPVMVLVPIVPVPPSESEVFTTMQVPPVPAESEVFTTTCVKNLPNNLKRDQLLKFLMSKGFHGINLCYMPFDFKRESGMGYAFINFELPEQAERFQRDFSGFSHWHLDADCHFASDKVAEVCWSEVQGLSQNIERYRNSPVMHPSVPDEFKPVLLSHGARASFPKPTRPLRAPKARPGLLQ